MFGRAHVVFGAISSVVVAVGISLAVFAAPLSTFAADGAELNVLINGAPPTGFCVAGPITVSGSGKTGGQGSDWHLAIGWGDGTASTTSMGTPTIITSGDLGGHGHSFTYSATHVPADASSGITVILYHVQESGQDGQVIVVNQCVAPPTQGVVVLAKHVVNDSGTGGALASAFTLTINSQNFTGSETGATPGVLLNEGTYPITESGPSDYDQTSVVCGDGLATTTSASVTVVAGHNYRCTVTNDDSEPTTATLTLQKTVVKDNGGTAEDTAWTLSAEGPTPISGSEGNASVTNATVNPGTYTLSESADPAGYTASDWVCTGTGTQDGDTITLAAGQSATCTIENDDVAPSLTLEKVVVNAYRGVAAAADWVLSAIGPVTLSGNTPVASDGTFQAGTYGLSESGPDGYNVSAWVCEGGEQSGDSITLGLGETATCTITNSDKEPGILHIIKVVQNDNAPEFKGTASEGDFTLSVSGGNPDPSSVEGTEAPGADVEIDGDAAYTVTETGGPSGYHTTYSAGCADTMPQGGEKTCTVTNNDNDPAQAYLTIRKIVVNDNGGEALASEWTLMANASELSNGVATLIDPGSYSISETGGPESGYELMNITCSTDGSEAVETSSLDVEAGHSYECTVTNDDIAPSLTLDKVTAYTHGGAAPESSWTLTADGGEAGILSGPGAEGSTDVVSDENFQAGTYALSESVAPAGYENGASYSCVKNGGEPISGNSIELAVGDIAVCTITNTDLPGTLIIQKTVINNNGGSATASDFSFRVNGGEPTSFDETADDDGNPLSGENTVSVNAGSYAVTEDAFEGYGVTLGEDCTGTIANGETKTCTVTNDDGKATLIIVKDTVGANGTFTFALTGHEESTIVTADNTGTETIALDAGEYDVTETNIRLGWTLDGGHPVCVYDNESVGIDITDGGHITLAPGDTVTCTFTNTASGTDLSLTKSVDDSTPDAGQTITYTLTVANAGPAAGNDIIVHDVLPSGITYVSDNGAGSYATSTGDWSIASLTSGSSTSLQITAMVNASAGTTVTNTAVITSSNEDVTDYNDANDSGSVSLTVNTPNTPAPSDDGGGDGGGGGGGGGGCASGTVYNFTTGRCEPKGQVLGAATSALPELPPGCIALLSTYMRSGMANDSTEVRKLQQFLNDEVHSGLPITGFFGPLTDAAVRGFQVGHRTEVLLPWGLTESTGFVYLTTQRWINLTHCASLNIPMPVLVPFSGR